MIHNNNTVNSFIYYYLFIRLKFDFSYKFDYLNIDSIGDIKSYVIDLCKDTNVVPLAVIPFGKLPDTQKLKIKNNKFKTSRLKLAFLNTYIRKDESVILENPIIVPIEEIEEDVESETYGRGNQLELPKSKQLDHEKVKKLFKNFYKNNGTDPKSNYYKL